MTESFIRGEQNSLGVSKLKPLGLLNTFTTFVNIDMKWLLPNVALTKSSLHRMSFV